jgi:hypothetical protein
MANLYVERAKRSRRCAARGQLRRPHDPCGRRRPMANDLITFGVGMYVWKIVFIVLFFLVAIVVAYPWLLLILIGI